MEPSRPGELLSQDTFYVDQLKGAGKAYLRTVVDTSNHSTGRNTVDNLLKPHTSRPTSPYWQASASATIRRLCSMEN